MQVLFLRGLRHVDPISQCRRNHRHTQRRALFLVLLLLGLWSCGNPESEGESTPEPSRDSRQETPRSSVSDAPEATSANPTGLTGPDLNATRAALTRVTEWMSQHRFHPTRDGLDEFRDYALELRTWYLLYLFETDAAAKAEFLSEARQRLELLSDGRTLVDSLRAAPIKKYIGDLLIVMNAARGMNYSAPALEASLPELIQAGIDTAPNRPVGLRIALAWLIHDLGFEIGPTVDDLRADGMLGTEPPETSMSQIAVYILTHEIYGFSDYGLRSMKLKPKEKAYADRVLPFWTAFFAEQKPNADLCAELLNSLQVAGLTHTSEYARGMRFLLGSQEPEGYFRMPSAEPSMHELVHAAMVGAHALLAHEALLEGRKLPRDRG